MFDDGTENVAAMYGDVLAAAAAEGGDALNAEVSAAVTDHADLRLNLQRARIALQACCCCYYTVPCWLIVTIWYSLFCGIDGNGALSSRVLRGRTTAGTGSATKAQRALSGCATRRVATTLPSRQRVRNQVPAYIYSTVLIMRRVIYSSVCL